MKVLFIDSIKPLDEKNGRARFSLREGKTLNATYVCEEGETDCPFAVGDDVVITEREFETAAGDQVKGWFVASKVKPAEFVRREALRDLDTQIATAKMQIKQDAAIKLGSALKAAGITDLSLVNG